jgi:UDP-N-acetyl-2-amino-2-deoxyglucuronate dehydrogenase
MEGEEIEFSDGFTELHTDSYKAILEGNGFPIAVSKKAIEIVHGIRNGMK